MSKSYNTISSSLFAKHDNNEVPDWIDADTLSQINMQQESLDVGFSNKTAFNDMYTVQRDSRDYSLRNIQQTYDKNRLILATKTELAKFLTGKYYNTNIIVSGDSIQAQTKIANIPATFIFPYELHSGHVKAGKLFSINLPDKDDEGEYPFNKAGLNECLEDIRLGRVKTGEKAKSYKAYTITLEEVVRRFNGDQRAALDKVRELVASQDIIGVASNTFATVYALDSLFPQMKKEGTLEKEPSFEFVKNKQHIAKKMCHSSVSLMTEASDKLQQLFGKQVKIFTFERNNDKFKVVASIPVNHKFIKANFNIDINNERLANIDNCEINNKQYSIEQLLKLNTNSKVLNAYLADNKNNESSKIVLTRSYIHKQLQNILAKDIINEIIKNWEDRQLIKSVDNFSFTSEYSLNELLDKVDTKLLTNDEKQELLSYQKRVQANSDRIEQKDTGFRNDKKLIFSQAIRLASLYNKLSTLLDQFELSGINNDCSIVNIINYSERGKENLTIKAAYKDNKCIKASIQAKKKILASLQLYKKSHKTGIFAKSIFSENMLKETCAQIFEDVDQAVKLASKYVTSIGNGFYSSEYPLSAIINNIDLQPISEQTYKERLQQQARIEASVQADYVKDTGIRNDQVYSNTIRLASVYNLLSNKLGNFSFISSNDDVSQLKVQVASDQGLNTLTINASYDRKDVNQCTDIKIEGQEQDTKALALYKQSSKKNIFAKAVFSHSMLTNLIQ